MWIRRSKNHFIVLVLDIVLLAGAFYLANLIRFDFKLPDWAMARFVEFLPYVVTGKLFFFYMFRLYKGMWRYTGLNDLFNIIKATTTASIVLIVFILYKNRFEMVSRSVFIIDWCLAIMLIVGSRLITRLCFERFAENVSLKNLWQTLVIIFQKKKNRVRGMIIIGAGDCGERICRQFHENPSVQSFVVGFLDDDKSKIGRRIHGVPVLGVIDALETTADSLGVDDVLIAIPSLSAERMRQIVELCKNSNINFKTVPDMGEVIDGKISINAIRDVEYRDLLGRQPVKLDKDRIGKYLGGKHVLVTGAGGSIGTGLCRQICRYAPKRIILFERAESPLYEIDIELKKSFPDVEVIPVLGDIQNKNELNQVFEQTRPDIVFHAAAYKHVPMLENHPWKAIENNVFGTENILQITRKFDCDKFVFVSTDKAVNPTNVMGASKRVAELLVQNMNYSHSLKTRFMTVRFGNVIGSVGSVIPLFKKQIRDGGPVTVTHPDIIRYFMLIPEACQLILQAGAMGNGGEIFILEMGEPVRIETMARDLIRFSGFEPDVDIKIEYTGLRPGEKLFEELMTDNEDVIQTGHEKIRVLKSRRSKSKDFETNLENLKKAATNRNNELILHEFKKIVPEFKP